MAFTLIFIKSFFLAVGLISPILILLLIAIVAIGIIIGRLEGWSRIDTFYYTFITATTVGYGDFPPRRNLSKMLAIIVAFLGLIYTGIVVAAALYALTTAIENSGRKDMVLQNQNTYISEEMQNKCPAPPAGNTKDSN